MCRFRSPLDRIPCGLLFKNEQNLFAYCCSECNQEFALSSELEQHILAHDIKNEIDTVVEENNETDVRLNVQYSLRSLRIPITRLLSTDLLKNKQIRHDTETQETDTLDINKSENESSLDTDCINLDQSPNSEIIQPDEPLIVTVSKPGPKSKTKTTLKLLKKRLTSMKKREKSFECDICKAKFSSYGFVKRHILDGHKTKNDWCRIKPKRKKKDPVPCKICGKMLVAINLHMRTFHSDDRPFKCNTCGLTYKYKSNLESHERLHTGDRPWLCEWCSRAFKRNSEMHAHINLVHKKVRKHKCDRTGCDKSYVNLQQLKDHINVHHLNLKNSYHCAICDRTMGTNKQYRQHMRDHLEKKYACRYCESKFPTDLGRKLHEFGTHSTDSKAVLL